MKHTNLFSLLSNLKFKRQRQDFEGVILVTKKRGLRCRYGKERAIKVKYQQGSSTFLQYNNYVRIVVPRLIYNDAVPTTQWKLMILQKEADKTIKYENDLNSSDQLRCPNQFYHKQIL